MVKYKYEDVKNLDTKLVTRALENFSANKVIEAPALQNALSVSYAVCRDILGELERKRKIEYVGGIKYRLIEEKNDEENVEISLEERIEQKREELRKRKEEILRRLSFTDDEENDDEEKDNDYEDDEDDYDEDDEEDEDEDDEDEDEISVEELRRRQEAIFRRLHIIDNDDDDDDSTDED